MLKKFAFGAAVLFVLLGAGFLVLRQVAGPSDGATLLPPETILYVSLTDLPRSVLRWQGTSMAEISREPEVKAFLEKPIGRIQADPGSGEAGGILGGLKPTRLFLGVTSISADRAQAIVGFQFWGSRKEFDQAMSRLRRELPPSEESRESRGGVEVVSTQHGKFAVHTASKGRWGFLSTSPELLDFVLQRLKGGDPAASLAGAEDFRASMAPMLPAPDFVLFLRPEKPIDALLEAGRSIGASAIPAQVEEIRRTSALAATWKMDGRLQRDAAFLLQPGGSASGALGHSAARFTQANTVLYIDFLARLAGLEDLLSGALPERQDAARELAGLAANAFGPEGGFLLNWIPGQMTPSPLLALQIRDPGQAADALRKLISFFPEATITDHDGLKLYNIPSVSNPLAAPTLALTDDFLLVGLEAGAITSAAAPAEAPLPSLPAFAPALPAYRSANEVFAFLDTRAVFERAYSAFRPVILFGAQVVPGMSEVIDTTKLPQTETIARHLPPVILSQKRIRGGVLIESSGPVTVSQLAIGLAAGAAWSGAKNSGPTN